VKVLYLLRHAKSSWSDPHLSDDERPLAPRGRRAAAAMLRHLQTEGIEPALVLCSPARRTIETCDRIAPAFGPEVSLLIDEALYGASAEELVRRLQAVPPTIASVMIVGHNPGLQDLAIVLAGSGERGALERLRSKFPTGALATLAVESDSWRPLGTHCARLVGFVVPRELA
jgi:phosphohistidine phosphatase